MKYLKKFSKHSDYLNYLPEILKSTVSICKLENDVHYDINYNSKQYFTSEALGSGTFTVTIGEDRSTEELHNISYSLDNGETWTTIDNVDDQAVTITTPSVNAGDKVLWKGESVRLSNGYGSNYATRFSSTCSSYNVSGNIMSLVYGDNFNTRENLNKKIQNACFCEFFYLSNNLNSAKNLYFPSKLGNWSCRRMFYSCQNLIDIPSVTISSVGEYSCYEMFHFCINIRTASQIQLSAPVLLKHCYSYMFSKCSKLEITPKFSVAILADHCCTYMFRDCTSLTTPPKLPSTTLASYCYSYMFSGCKNLTIAPLLPATILADDCYDSMFFGCTSLTTAPELPATILASNCYLGMFASCTSLTTAPVLSATTLADKCYGAMFQSCTSLTTAPTLPATTLAEYCYHSMFSYCTKLTTPPELPATTLAPYCYAYMFQNCTKLIQTPILPATTFAKASYRGMFANTNFIPDLTHIDFTSQTIVASGILEGLFADSYITDNDLMNILPKNQNNKYCLPVMTLADHCYDSMFEHCTRLTTPPELPATTLASGCYSHMFRQSRITTPPELPATTLANYCYYYMFQDCTYLNDAPKLAAKTYVTDAYRGMFDNCNNLTLVVCLLESDSTINISSFLPFLSSSKNGILIVPENQTWSGLSSNWSILHVSNEEVSLTATYNVSNINYPTKTIISNWCKSLSFFDKIEIDGVEQSEVVRSYTFSTEGEHTVKYYFVSTIIPDSAFESTSMLSSAILTNNIHSIGKEAFYNTDISSINLPSSLISLGSKCFSYTDLTSITIPQGVTIIPQLCFLYSKLNSLTIPNNVTTIEGGAFARCPLTTLTIGSGVTNIVGNPFYPKNLESITVDSNNTTYDSRNNCNAIIRKSDNALIIGCLNTVIPANITRIEDNAFYDVELDSITISNNITYIGEYAINACSKYIFTSVQQLFDLCAGKVLHAYSTGDEEEEGDIIYGEIYINENKLTSITTPSNITSINYNTFYFINYISGITSITLSDNVTSISSLDLYLINTFNFGNGVTTIPSHVLGWWNNIITTITLGNNVTTIESQAFSLFESLTTINIPDSVTYIGDSAFYGCTSLTDLTIRNKILSINPKAFDEPEEEWEGD